MFWTLFCLVLVSFAIGGVAIWTLNKRSHAREGKKRWIKYVFYLVVVMMTIWCIQFGIMQHMAIVLVAIGAYEIVIGWRRSNRRVPFLLVSALFYMAVSFGFYRFSRDVAPEGLLYVYSVVFTFDGFAQITGQLLGKKRILPKISPDKTVAGLVGGYVSGAAVGLFMLQWVNMPLWAPGCSPLLICTAAFTGDVLASWYKRRCGLKDYSGLIPGHGGILDRYDSFLASGAVFWLAYA